MENPFKKINSREKEPVVKSRIELDMFRHSMKEKKDPEGGNDDSKIALTPEGRLFAMEQGSDGGDTSLVYSSGRDRTSETGLYKMAGGNEEITGKEEGLAELLEKVDSELNIGSRLGTDKRLDFHLLDPKESKYVEKLYEKFGEGKFLEFLVYQSDALAKETGDDESFTYKKAVQNIGGILKKYLKVSDRWDDIVQNDDKEKYSTNTLKRFLATHQGVSECFLAEVIKQRLGQEKLDIFINILDNAGFDFVEGYKIDIETLNNGEKNIRVIFSKDLDDNKKFEVNEVFSEKEILDMIENV